MEKSKGTDAFIAEFERLIAKCVRAAAKGPRGNVRKAFELLFALLRRLDTDSNDVVFFADEGGSWQVGVDWRVALAGYFQCLADVASADEFAREVDRAIRDFSEYDRPRSSGHRSQSVQARTEGVKALAWKRGALLLKGHLSARFALAQVAERS